MSLDDPQVFPLPKIVVALRCGPLKTDTSVGCSLLTCKGGVSREGYAVTNGAGAVARTQPVGRRIAMAPSFISILRPMIPAARVPSIQWAIDRCFG